ncbi:MAG: hypothetical protein PUB13_04455 [Lachnospiraceae bacterium]|nr:hypothetical protein [Lachnospiraceae bacterium]
MLFQEAKTLLPQWKVEDIETGTVYVIDHIQVNQNSQRVMIYAREEKTRKPVCLDHRKIRKIHLIDVVRKQMAEREAEREKEETQKERE